MQLRSICCQKPSAETVKQRAVSSEGRPVSHGRETPVTPRQGIPRGTRHCPALSGLTSPPPLPPRPGRGRFCSVGGHSTCAPRASGAPAPLRPAWSPKRCPRKEQKGRAGRREEDRPRWRASQLPWSTDPMMRRGWQCPSLNAASLCIWKGWGLGARCERGSVF